MADYYLPLAPILYVWARCPYESRHFKYHSVTNQVSIEYVKHLVIVREEPINYFGEVAVSDSIPDAR